MRTILSQENVKRINKYAKKLFVKDNSIDEQALKEWIEKEIQKQPDNKDEVIAVILACIAGCAGLALTFSLSLKIFVWFAIKTGSLFWSLFFYYLSFFGIGGACLFGVAKIAEDGPEWSNSMRLYFMQRRAFAEAKNELKHMTTTI